MVDLPNVTRADFIRSLALVGTSALIMAPSASGAAPSDLGKNERFQQKKEKCGTRLTLDYRLDDGEQLKEIGNYMQARGSVSDMYATGDLAENFEKKLASLLGKPAACWMPTGTMAQLIALRLFAARSGSRTIGWHPSSHHLLHEQNAYSHVHQLESKIICPWERPVLAEDVANAPSLAAVSVELPVRWIGQTQTWEQLQALKSAAAKKRIPLMMDGARLWETQPYYDVSYAEICDGFDAVYVSFYKMLGAPGGAMLLGESDFIEEAKVWRHRLGGNIFQNAVFIAAADMQLDRVLPKLPLYRETAVALARALSENDDLIVMPDPPQTNLFRVFLPGDPGEIAERRDEIAAQTGIWVGDYFRAARVPGLTQVELQIGEGLQIDSVPAAARAFADLVI